MQSGLRLLIFGASRQALILLNCKTIDLDQVRIIHTREAAATTNCAHFKRIELNGFSLD